MLLFNSLPFFVFLAAVIIIYYILPKKFQWIVLLCASFVFYTTFSWKFLFFIVATILTIFLATNFFDKQNSKQELELTQDNLTKEQKKEIKSKYKKKKKIVLIFTILFNIGILFLLKYTNFLLFNVTSLANLIGIQMSRIELQLILPLGISFYTFQSVGYLIDVYWGKVATQKNIFKLSLFVSFFPQIVQGPISRYSELEPQLSKEHNFDYGKITDGLKLILWGLFKKMIIADGLAVSIDTIFSNIPALNGVQANLGIIFYFIQDYADFSGCIDIARGAAKCFGIDLAKNFERPFFSLSVPEYWRRWHITLGTWFKDYIFYPLSISKFSLKLGTKSKKIFKKFGSQIPAIFGLMLVWLSTGVWHGASWNYIMWGIYFGVLIIMGIVFKPLYTKIIKKLKLNVNSFAYKCFQWIRTMYLLFIGRIIFRTSSLGEAWTLYKKTFDIFNPSYWQSPLKKLSIRTETAIVALVCALILLIVDLINEYMKKKEKSMMSIINSKPLAFRWCVWLVLILAVVVFGNYGAAYVPIDFIYMQF